MTGLRAWSEADLEKILQRVRDGLIRSPVTDADLRAARLAGTLADAPWLAKVPDEALPAVIEAILAERRETVAPDIELVWTGPDVAATGARDTAVVVRELFEGAAREVWLAGYAFDHGDEIFAPLHAGMTERGVEAHLFIDLPRAPGALDLEQHVAIEVARFVHQKWRMGPPLPRIYYSTRGVQAGALSSLHAKCVVADEARALVTSANFTNRGQDRNIEVGALIHDGAFARRLVHQLRQAVAGGVFVEAVVAA